MGTIRQVCLSGKMILGVNCQNRGSGERNKLADLLVIQGCKVDSQRAQLIGSNQCAIPCSTANPLWYLFLTSDARSTFSFELDYLLLLSGLFGSLLFHRFPALSRQLSWCHLASILVFILISSFVFASLRASFFCCPRGIFPFFGNIRYSKRKRRGYGLYRVVDYYG